MPARQRRALPRAGAALGRASGAPPPPAEHGRAWDRHVIEWNVGVPAAVARAHLLDLVDDLAALDDLAEHRVAPPLLRFRLEVEELVVASVDEELGGSGMRRRSAGHGHRVVHVSEPVRGLVLDRRPRRLLAHAWLEATALHHA